MLAAGGAVMPAALVVVEEGKMMPPPVVVGAVVDPPIMIGPAPVVPAEEPVAVPPIVPVQEAPVGQQATCRAASAEQMAVVGQQVLGAPRLEHGL